MTYSKSLCREGCTRIGILEAQRGSKVYLGAWPCWGWNRKVLEEVRGEKERRGRLESKEECSMGRVGDGELQHVQMALGLRSPARACFDSPQKGRGVGKGKGRIRAAAVSHSGWLPESGSERTLGVALQKAGER